MLELNIDGQHIPIKLFKFPAGETGISFDHNNGINKAVIKLSWESNDDLINLCLLVDAIRRVQFGVEIELISFYFPYARQDRVCNAGESLSVKVVADIINSLKFKLVFVLDPHSEVLGAVLNNICVIDMEISVAKALNKIPGEVALVSPDAGANKKVMGYAKAFGGLPVIRADKTRDTKTGAITGTVVYSKWLGDTNLLVVDDIADGAGTFIPLAFELRKITNGSVSLLVSHGIFTKGVDIMQGVYDNIFVVNNMYGDHCLITKI